MEIRDFLNTRYGISPSVADFVSQCEEELAPVFAGIEKAKQYNNLKVLNAFQESQVANRHFFGTTGYGYSDEGRDKLGEVFARIFGAEKAIVSPQVCSGTHALTIALFGLLRPLDAMLSITGRPYDTLLGVIGLGQGGNGSLAEFSIKYLETELTHGHIDVQRVLDMLHLNKNIKMVYLQRSRGYEWRPSIPVAEIGEAIQRIKERFPNVLAVVDNCYGEFTEPLEPTDVGADLIIGSLIKNPGGGIAPTGAYFAGRADCIDRVGERLTCPGIGTEIGSYLAGYLPYYQGIYLAPTIVATALKGAVLTSRVFQKLGYQVFPEFSQPRTDITQAIRFQTEEELVAYIRSVQDASPVDSHVTPYPWDMPGYQDQVIMAAGAFIQGGSIELSADAPIREPYIAYMQGGMTYEQVRLSVMLAIKNIGLEI